MLRDQRRRQKRDALDGGEHDERRDRAGRVVVKRASVQVALGVRYEQHRVTGHDRQLGLWHAGLAR